MNPGASAATATGKYLQRYIECRELEAEIYSKPASVPPNMSEVELGKSFALSALYGLNLDVSECKLCFRCCRKDDSVSPPFATVNGVFDFIQTLMSLTVADINREPGIMKSYSECLAVPLLRYSRGEELRVTNVVTNSVVSDGVISPVRELTSYNKMTEHPRFVPSRAAVAVYNAPFKGFDMYRSDWDLRKMNRKASYRKDLEIVTNAEPADVYGDIDALRAYYVKAISGGGSLDADCRFPLIAEYLSNAENLERERAYYRQLIQK